MKLFNFLSMGLISLLLACGHAKPRSFESHSRIPTAYSGSSSCVGLTNSLLGAQDMYKKLKWEVDPFSEHPEAVREAFKIIFNSRVETQSLKMETLKELRGKLRQLWETDLVKEISNLIDHLYDLNPKMLKEFEFKPGDYAAAGPYGYKRAYAISDSTKTIRIEFLKEMNSAAKAIGQTKPSLDKAVNLRIGVVKYMKNNPDANFYQLTDIIHLSGSKKLAYKVLPSEMDNLVKEALTTPSSMSQKQISDLYYKSMGQTLDEWFNSRNSAYALERMSMLGELHQKVGGEAFHLDAIEVFTRYGSP